MFEFKNKTTEKCTFDPLSDVEQTVPELSVNIAEIMATHTVPNTGTEAPYSKEDDVKGIGHYITDKIDAAVAAYRMRKSMASARQSVESKTVNAAPAAQ